MAQLNKVFLIGNLTRDPEVRTTPKGSAVVDLGLATNRTWRDEKGNEKEEVCYVTVVVWGKQAEAAGKYLRKGRPVFVEGRLQFESWEKNGEKRSILKVHGERIQFLGESRGEDSARESDARTKPSVEKSLEDVEQDGDADPSPSSKSKPENALDDEPF